MSCEKEPNLPSYLKQLTSSKSIHLAICIAFLKVYVYLGNYHHQLNLMSLLIDLQYYPRSTRDIYQYVRHFPFFVFPYLPHTSYCFSSRQLLRHVFSLQKFIQLIGKLSRQIVTSTEVIHFG